jgi:N-acetylneuraminate lyase
MPDFLEAAAERIPTLAGLKFTNSDLMAYQRCLRCCEGRFDVPWGCDEFLLAALALGGRGAVGSSYNFAAPLYLRLIEAFRKGDLAAAREEQFRSVCLIQWLARFGYMAAAKAVMEMLGIPVGPPRLPIVALAPGQTQELRRGLEQMGFFDWIDPRR